MLSREQQWTKADKRDYEENYEINGSVQILSGYKGNIVE
jgi:hypothetical protein